MSAAPLTFYDPRQTAGGNLSVEQFIRAGSDFDARMDPLRLYLHADFKHLPDWQIASRHLSPARGIVVAENLKCPEKIGAIYITDAGKYTRWDDESGEPIAGHEPSALCVLAVGPDVHDLKPGDLILACDGDGCEFEGFASGPYKAQMPVRFFGRYNPEGKDQGVIERIGLDEGILATISEPAPQMTPNEVMSKIIPFRRNILIRKDPFQATTEGGILLCDLAQERTSTGVIEAVGPLVTDAKVGERHIYHPEGETEFKDSDDPDLRIIHDDALLSEIEPEAISA